MSTPSRTFQVAMIGVGDITALHRPAYRDFELARLVALCDVDETLLARRAAQWGIDRTCRDYAQILEDPEIDIVEINLPHHLHRQVVVEALDAGKHVACQKPIATTVADAQAMIEAERRSPGRLRILENFVFYPPYVKAKELLDAGAIGRPLTIRFKLGSSLFGSRWIPLKSELWHLMESEKGMGQAVFDDGYHKLSLAVHFIGPIEAVKGFIDRSFEFIDEPGQLIWRYRDSDTLGSFDLAFSPNLYTHSAYFPADERIDLVGTEGMMQLTGCTGRLVDEAPLILVRGGQRIELDDLETDWQASFTAGIRDFPRALVEGRETLISAARALELLKFAYALIVAARTGREIRPDEVTDDLVRRELELSP
ncbi:MAG: Gfo/Idh/MocA family oxidoreductase [Bradymonadales bacterium]|nr:Gfo/Idh/MocA family oxidoreductase [Bradymonadales bacterium]